MCIPTPPIMKATQTDIPVVIPSPLEFLASRGVDPAEFHKKNVEALQPVYKSAFYSTKP